MGIDKRPVSELSLWPHQYDAVVRCEQYFQAGVHRAALVHMPTGTGKTGVMAVLATRRALQKPILVVCPSAALVDQLRADFASDFWEKIGAAKEWQPDRTLKLLPSNLDPVIETMVDSKGQRLIVVGTIQSLQQIHVEGGTRKLKDHIGTVIFDEGHREPAPLWAEVVRGLEVPTILFSATPFRSDLKIFDVDDKHIFFLSFKEAASKSLIRSVNIVTIKLPLNPMEFAGQIINTRDRLLQEKQFPPQCKMIVRAGNEEDVYDLFNAFAELLKKRKDGVLALHHNFVLEGDKGRQLRPDVPRDLRTRSEKFLVHQFMLTEGIDDPSCTMLALFEPFENERQLVQQIGRLTRQPGTIGEKATPAYVLARAEDGVDRMWDRFLAYDAACIANGGKPPIRNSQHVLEKLVDALPKMDYFAGQFRERINLDHVGGHDLCEAWPSSVLLRQRGSVDRRA
jgi:superfamily II DNA or RNA helicase